MKRREKDKLKAAMEQPEPKPESEPGTKDKVSKMDKISKIKKKRRFGMPGSFVCKGCNSVLSEGLKVNAVKEIVGEIRQYKIKCPCCGHKIVLERTVCGRYRIVEGVLFDWAGYRKQCSQRFFGSAAPGSSGRDCGDVFETFNIALMVRDPTTNGPYRAI